MLRLKCTKFDFGWGSAPDPLGELTALQTPQLNLRGLLLRGGKAGEGKGGRKGKEGSGKRKGDGKGEGGEGRGRETGMGGKV